MNLMNVLKVATLIDTNDFFLKGLRGAFALFKLEFDFVLRQF